jgi:hypothetical protein
MGKMSQQDVTDFGHDIMETCCFAQNAANTYTALGTTISPFGKFLLKQQLNNMHHPLATLQPLRRVEHDIFTNKNILQYKSLETSTPTHHISRVHNIYQ